jgi:hypothetical protein
MDFFGEAEVKNSAAKNPANLIVSSLFTNIFYYVNQTRNCPALLDKKTNHIF